MNQLKITQLLIGALVITTIYSCAPKYQAHFTPTKGSEFQTSLEIEPVENVFESQPASDPLEVTQGLESGDMLASTSDEIAVESASSLKKMVTKHKEKIEALENAAMPHKDKKMAVKQAKKSAKKEIKRELKKEIKEMKRSGASDQYVLMMILAIFIPPLAVGLTFGIVDKFWISLILTLLFFIPGMVYSLIVVQNHYKS